MEYTGSNVLNVFPSMEKILACPNCCPFPATRAPRLQRCGVFFRSTNPNPIQRYRCLDCCRGFSEATLTFEYRQKRRDINFTLYKHLVSTVSQRRSAIILGINRKTCARRLPYFASVARSQHLGFLLEKNASLEIQFDDMESSEHTKLKPLSIPLACEHPTRLILAFDVVSMPAKGLLAKISRAKYGLRPDHRKLGWNNVLRTVATTSTKSVTITSDSHKFYPAMIQKHLPEALHIQTKSRRACVAGQGELKKGGYDPLFTLNHTAACFRANINRLIRKTWCTTKKRSRLKDHMACYVLWHNERILAKLQGRKAKFPFEGLC